MLSQRRAALEREWVKWIPDRRRESMGEQHGPLLRSEVAESWLRSLSAVDPSLDGAPSTRDGDPRSRWLESPLRVPLVDLADQLRSITENAGYVAAVTDEDGTILWSCGSRYMRRRAERVNFAPGSCWDEAHTGTNALSLALRTGRPHTVFSAEHFLSALHGWVCYCAPIHAPDGTQLGVLDLSTTWDRSHPLAMGTVQTTATALEAKLSHLLPSASAELELTCLGSARLTRRNQTIRLRLRLFEILTLLALEPDGLTSERLHYAIYGERPISSSTLKADVSSLRRAIGGDITARVYRLTVPVSCDAVDLLHALRTGDTTTAVRLYRGHLLPGSETPGIVEWREHLEVGVRTAVLASRNGEHALRYGESVPGDIEVHEHALRTLPAYDARRAVVTARLHTALRA